MTELLQFTAGKEPEQVCKLCGAPDTSGRLTGVYYTGWCRECVMEFRRAIAAYKAKTALKNGTVPF